MSRILLSGMPRFNPNPAIESPALALTLHSDHPVWRKSLGMSRTFLPTYTLPTLLHITMINKRKFPDSRDGEGTLDSKRSRLFNSKGSNDLPTSSQPQIDPTYGQRGAFPGLDGNNDDETLFHGPASDGLEYLRMVR